jgi:hypothetical protein
MNPSFVIGYLYFPFILSVAHTTSSKLLTVAFLQGGGWDDFYSII